MQIDPTCFNQMSLTTNCLSGTSNLFSDCVTTSTTNNTYVPSTVNVPYIGSSSISTSGGTISTSSGTQWIPFPQQPPKPILNVDTKLDDDNKEVLVLSLGDKKDCKWKMHLLPGIEFYSPHGRPSKFRRFIFGLLFGFKWENTLAEKFIDQL